MHFATPRQLAFLILAWALLLVAYDHHATQKPFSAYWAEFKGSSTRPTVVAEGDQPRVRVTMPHLCCTESIDEIRAAVAPLTWLAPVRLDHEPPASGKAPSVSSDAMNGYTLDFDLVDVRRADFVLLEQAIRSTGFVPERLEISGMGHFRLEAELPHLCCTVCSRAVDEQLERLIRQAASGRWLDSMTLDHDKKVVLLYARLNAVVDLLELDAALGRAGFAARSLRVLTGPES